MKSIPRLFKELRRTLKVVKDISDSIQNGEVEVFIDLQKLLINARILKKRGKFEKENLVEYQKHLPERLHPLMQKLWTLMNSPLGSILLKVVEKTLEHSEKLKLL